MHYLVKFKNYQICFVFVFCFNNFYFFIKQNLHHNFFFYNSFWNYIYILNDNNNSVLLIIIIAIIYNIFYCKNIFIKILVVLLFFVNSKINLLNFIITDFIPNNTSLINGLLLIHPFLVYVTYISCLYLYHVFFLNKNLNIFVLTNLYKYLLFILILSWLSLILGGLWAQQELNWGGWWNWDFVEIILLVIFLHIVCLLHYNIYKNYNIVTIFFISLIFFLFLFIYLVRIDIINSIHNFNSINLKDNYFYFLLKFFLTIIFLKFFYLFNFFKKYNTYNYNIINFILKNINNILLIYIYSNILLFEQNIFLLELNKYIKYLYIYIFIYFFIFLNIKKVFFYFCLCLYIINFFFFENFFFLYFFLVLYVYYQLTFKHFFLFLFMLFVIYFGKFNMSYNFLTDHDLNKFYINNNFILTNLNLNFKKSNFFNEILNYSYLNKQFDFFFHNVSDIYINNLILFDNITMVYNLFEFNCVNISDYIYILKNNSIFFIVLSIFFIFFFFLWKFFFFCMDLFTFIKA